MTIDKLAAMVANGFSNMENRIGVRIDGLDTKIEALDHRMEVFDHRMEVFEGKLDGINNRIDDLAVNRATRDEHKQLDARVTRIERKLAI
jgi:hypothetical protein